MIEPVMDGDWETWDIFGVNLSYCRGRKAMKLDMAKSIEKLLVKFRMQDCKPAATPCVKGGLRAGTEDSTFPIRSLIGALLHVSNMCRPDISFAVQRAARHMAPTCTTSAVKAAKRVPQYLKGTKDLGISYTPAVEASFRKVYRDILKADQVTKSPRVVHTRRTTECDTPTTQQQWSTQEEQHNSRRPLFDRSICGSL